MAVDVDTTVIDELSEPEVSAESDADESEATAAVDEESGAHAEPPARLRVRNAFAVGLVLVTAIAGLCGWLGFQLYQADQVERQGEAFLQVGRQAAVNLTTIDFETVDADIQRVVDSSTGSFHDDFEQRSAAFADVVKQAKSKSEGTVTAAGIESIDGNSAQILVSASVNTSTAAAGPEQQPRHWRMRITVQKVDDEIKVSNVGFVS